MLRVYDCSESRSQVERPPSNRLVKATPLIALGLITCLTVFISGESLRAQEGAASEVSSQKVLLRWKFKPGQIYQGKLAWGIKTTDERIQQTTFIDEFTWEVQSIRDDGRAIVELAIQRQRFSHHSDRGRVNYDSMHDSAFAPSDELLSEVKVFVDLARKNLDRKYRLLFSDRGEVQSMERYDRFPSKATFIWPKLPENPVGVGDQWTDSNKDQVDQYKITEIEKTRDNTIVWIEKISDTSRFRFSVESGEYIDANSWAILSTRPDAPKSVVQSIAERRMIKRQGTPNPIEQLKLLQPNQPGQAMHMIRQSVKATDDLTEYLVGEKNSARAIENKLYIEHVENFKPPEISPDWSGFDWLMVAEYYQRIGDFNKRTETLKAGAQAIAVELLPQDYRGNLFLMQFAELLAETGEFEHAIRACQNISVDASSGLSVTLKGVFQVPKSALRNYGLMLVARQQAQAGLAEDSTSTAKMLSRASERSAAHWIVAMHLADLGKLEAAKLNIEFAEKALTPDSKIIEFEKDGPVEVPVANYRTLALGKMAISQALHDEIDGMNQTLEMIQSEEEIHAVLIDLIVALEKKGTSEPADSLIKSLPVSVRDKTIGYRIKTRLESGNTDLIETWIEQIKDPVAKATHRMLFCRALVSKNAGAENLQTQLSKTLSEVQKVSIPERQAPLLIQYAETLALTGQSDQASAQLTKALDAIGQSSSSNEEKIELRIQVASLLAKIDQTKNFEELTSNIERSLNTLPHDRVSTLQSILISVYLEQRQFQKAEAIAEQIQDASDRAVALANIAKRLAIDFEFERSRELFPKAFEAAMQVEDVLGLDTIYSKGGAVRYLGRMQGDCDLEGLIHYLQSSSNPNIRTFGYIGGVEALNPQAALAAMKLGRIPDGILRDECATSLTCKILTQQAE